MSTLPESASQLLLETEGDVDLVQQWMIREIASKFFNAELEGPIDNLDEEQRLQVDKLLNWAAKVVGANCINGVVDLDRAQIAAQDPELTLNPCQVRHLLEPTIETVNDALAKFRNFVAVLGHTNDKRDAVVRQTELMIHKLKGGLEQGTINETILHQRVQAIDDWGAKKKMEFDMQLGDLETEATDRIMDAAKMLLGVWRKLESSVNPVPSLQLQAMPSIVEEKPLDQGHVGNSDVMMLAELEGALALDIATLQDCIPSSPKDLKYLY